MSGVSAVFQLTPKTDFDMSIGHKNVTAAGTAEALIGTATYVTKAAIQAKKGNTGYVYIGDLSVDNSGDGGNFLSAGEVYHVEGLADLNLIYVDADTNGEGVTFTYWTYTV